MGTAAALACALPAAWAGGEPPAAPATPSSSAAAELDVPGTSATIRMLLDLQSRPAGARPVDAERPRPVVTSSPAAKAAPADETRVVDAVHDKELSSTTSREEPPARETPAADVTSEEPPRSSGTTPVAQPTAVRAFVAYLREHRTGVFVAGLLALAMAAVATAVSQRRRGARGRSRVSSTRAASTGRRRHRPGRS